MVVGNGRKLSESRWAHASCLEGAGVSGQAGGRFASEVALESCEYAC